MKKLILCILDGWGYRKAKEHNAIALSIKPNYEKLVKNYPMALLKASGTSVGLPKGQMGNSEVGHITIGAGRVILQDLPKIDTEIESGNLAKNNKVLSLIKELKNNNKTCHLIGLISDGGVHSHINHIINIATILKSQKIPVAIHGILDGRDVPPKSAIKYLKQLKKHSLKISTLSGRFYAMDRDKRWERTQKYFECIAYAKAPKFDDPEQFINNCYNNKIIDEFIEPHVEKNYQGISIKDAVIIANFRADRVRQISTALVLSKFPFFKRQPLSLSSCLSMTSYSEELLQHMNVIFPNQIPKNTLGEVIAKNNLTQLRIAETEKYAHVTYFFNGGRELSFLGEDRILIPSPKVTTYDQKPEMSAYELTDSLIKKMKEKKYDFICANFANPDMVGHSGNINATVEAIETVDKCLGKIMQAATQMNYEFLITADHGNAECLYDKQTKQPLTSHTLNPVPIIYFGSQKLTLKNGELPDIAPTILHLMRIKKPKEMTGKNLAKVSI